MSCLGPATGAPGHPARCSPTSTPPGIRRSSACTPTRCRGARRATTRPPASIAIPSRSRRALVERMAQLYGVPPAQLLVGRGSDEAIDLLVRAFCRAGQDNVVIYPPTFGMYKVAARIQGAGVRRGAAACATASRSMPSAVIAARPATPRSCSSARPTTRPATCSTKPRCCASARELAGRRWSSSTRPTSSSAAGASLAARLAEIPEPRHSAHAVEGLRTRRRARCGT